MAQPALGMQMGRLEKSLGVALLNRHPRGVSPTRAGQLLYEQACIILRLVDETEKRVAAAGRTEREGIVLGLTNGFSSIVGRDLLLQSRQKLPTVNLGLVEERSVLLVDAIERHEIDMALAYEVHQRPGLIRVPLLEEELLFVSARNATGASHPQAMAAQAPGTAWPPIEFSELAARKLVLPGQRDGTRQQVLDVARRLALELNVVADVSSISMMKNMVAKGDAETVLPYGNFVDDLAHGRLAGRRIINPPLKRTLYLVRSARRAPLSHETALLDLIEGICRLYAERLTPLSACLDAMDRPLVQALEEYQATGRDKNEVRR
ncbi:MAG: LysR family transcriptional regulator [Haliea sp.]|nr:MAG: LysR family transcriptional regulator [Haliea sp.]